MKYAVARIKGKQYKFSEGDSVLVDSAKDEKIVPEVLLFVDEKKVEVGTPVLKDVAVVFKVEGEEKGKKIDVLKYKAKSRYRKHIGFRPQYTKISVSKISSSK